MSARQAVIDDLVNELLDPELHAEEVVIPIDPGVDLGGVKIELVNPLIAGFHLPVGESINVLRVIRVTGVES